MKRFGGTGEAIVEIRRVFVLGALLAGKHLLSRGRGDPPPAMDPASEGEMISGTW